MGELDWIVLTVIGCPAGLIGLDNGLHAAVVRYEARYYCSSRSWHPEKGNDVFEHIQLMSLYGKSFQAYHALLLQCQKAGDARNGRGHGKFFPASALCHASGTWDKSTIFRPPRCILQRSRSGVAQRRSRLPHELVLDGGVEAVIGISAPLVWRGIGI